MVPLHEDALQFACEAFRAEPTFMLFAVQRQGRSLCHATTEVQNNKEVCQAAVKADGTALEFCGMQLRENIEVGRCGWFGWVVVLTG